MEAIHTHAIKFLWGPMNSYVLKRVSGTSSMSAIVHPRLPWKEYSWRALRCFQTQVPPASSFKAKPLPTDAHQYSRDTGAVSQEQGFKYLRCAQRDKWLLAAGGDPNHHFLSAVPLSLHLQFLRRRLPSHLTQFPPRLIPNTASASEVNIFFTQLSGGIQNGNAACDS